MLPRRHKITRSDQFRACMKARNRVSGPRLIIYKANNTADYVTGSPTPGGATATVAGPVVGLIIGKAVGNAVTRHRLARQLRHIFRNSLASINPGDAYVIRALPPAATATTEELIADVHHALRTFQRRR